MIIYPNPHSNDFFATENINNIADSGCAEDERRMAMLHRGYDPSREGFISGGRRVYENYDMIGREEIVS